MPLMRLCWGAPRRDWANLVNGYMEGKDVIEILVYPGSNKPYFITSEGIERGTYIRSGPPTKRADQTLISEIIQETERRYYDEQTLPQAKQSDFANHVIEEFYQTTHPSETLLLSDKEYHDRRLPRQQFPRWQE